MKISKSKQELARIISENGGWCDESEFAAQDGDGTGSIDFFKSTPRYDKDDKYWKGEYDFCERISQSGFTIKNFHQTILSRAEYFHLYPAPDAKPRFCESVVRSIPEPDEQVWTNPPTIEQLAADYRNAKDYAERKQQEADEAKSDVEAKLKALELAGEANGLIVSPITEKQEPEMAAAVKVGDEVECVESNIKRDKYNGMVGRLRTIDESDTSTPYLVDFGNEARIWCNEIKFIRRP